MCNCNKILMPKALTPHSQSRSSHGLVFCSYGWANGQLSRRRCVPSSVLLQEFDLESWSPDGLVPPQARPRGWLHAPTASTAITEARRSRCLCQHAPFCTGVCICFTSLQCSTQTGRRHLCPGPAAGPRVANSLQTEGPTGA